MHLISHQDEPMLCTEADAVDHVLVRQRVTSGVARIDHHEGACFDALGLRIFQLSTRRKEGAWARRGAEHSPKCGG